MPSGKRVDRADNDCSSPRWWNWSSRSRLQPSRQTSTSAERHTPTDLSIRIKTLGAEEKFMKKHVPAVYQTVRLLYLMIAVALPEALSRIVGRA
mmetsp:Transcript_12022/g.36094  ORF Transcript_12022/g.36094 Transcript_12022/m.36094 type:complete len:94 (+) Transcript_12022:327-608(+)